jgi:hypothetical protein
MAADFNPGKENVSNPTLSFDPDIGTEGNTISVLNAFSTPLLAVLNGKRCFEGRAQSSFDLELRATLCEKTEPCSVSQP